MPEGTWVVQKVESTEARLRFYSPRIWTLLIVIGMAFFFAAWAEAGRRDFVPLWTLIFLVLLAVFVGAGSLDLYRRSPEGVLHFQVDPSGVSIGCLAFRPVASAPYGMLQRILVGDRFEGLASPVIFEFAPSARGEPGLAPYLSRGETPPLVVRSYLGLERERFVIALAEFVHGRVPIVRFTSATQFAQLSATAA